MGFFRRAADKLNPARGRGKSGSGGSGAAMDAGVANHLTEFVRTRRGVEAFVEPKTIVTETTILLVAWDGEWTRRRVPSPQWAYSFAEHLQIPGYDALVVGYPQRMRDYNTRLTRKADDPNRAGHRPTGGASTPPSGASSAPAGTSGVPGAASDPSTPGGSDFADAASEVREFADDLEEEYRLPPWPQQDPRDLR